MNNESYFEGSDHSDLVPNSLEFGESGAIQSNALNQELERYDQKGGVSKEVVAARQAQESVNRGEIMRLTDKIVSIQTNIDRGNRELETCAVNLVDIVRARLDKLEADLQETRDVLNGIPQ